MKEMWLVAFAGVKHCTFAVFLVSQITFYWSKNYGERKPYDKWNIKKV